VIIMLLNNDPKGKVNNIFGLLLKIMK
jgi:hypothetical protein